MFSDLQDNVWSSCLGPHTLGLANAPQTWAGRNSILQLCLQHRDSKSRTGSRWCLVYEWGRLVLWQFLCRVLRAGHVAASHQPRHTTGHPSFSAPVKAARSSSSSSSPLQMLSGLSSRTSKGILEGIDANNLNRDLAVSGTWHQAAGVAGAEEASLISWAWRCPPGFIVRQSPLLPCLPMKAGLPAC